MTKYKEQKPISQVLEERRTSYEQRLREALDVAYSSRDLVQIEQFETGLASLCNSLTTDSEEKVAVRTTPRSGKPVLKWNLYLAARDSGETNKEILSRYRCEYPRQINVFSMEYAKLKRAETTESKPELTRELYEQSRDQGLTNDQIREKYSTKTRFQLNGFAANYAKKNRAKK